MYVICGTSCIPVDGMLFNIFVFSYDALWLIQRSLLGEGHDSLQAVVVPVRDTFT